MNYYPPIVYLTKLGALAIRLSKLHNRRFGKNE